MEDRALALLIPLTRRIDNAPGLAATSVLESRALFLGFNVGGSIHRGKQGTPQPLLLRKGTDVIRLRGGRRKLDPDLVITTGTLRQAVAESTFFSRVAVVGVAGGAGLLLALAGLFGTVSYEATRRLRETAIRRAVGASDAAARRSVVRGSLRSSGWGVLAGLVGAVVLGSVLRGLLHGLPPYDPPALAALATTLVVSGLAATWAPSRHALRVAPAELLKAD